MVLKWTDEWKSPRTARRTKSKMPAGNSGVLWRPVPTIGRVLKDALTIRFPFGPKENRSVDASSRTHPLVGIRIAY